MPEAVRCAHVLSPHHILTEVGIIIHRYPQTSENRSPEKLPHLPQLQGPDTQTQPLCGQSGFEELSLGISAFARVSLYIFPLAFIVWFVTLSAFFVLYLQTFSHN